MFGFHFSNTIMSSSKCIARSGFTALAFPLCVIINNLSSALNSPNNSPLSSTFKRCTASSNQILRGFKVETPSDLKSTLFMVYFVIVFPLTALPFTAKSAKSISHFIFLTLPVARRLMVTTSASPLRFAEK